MAANQAEKRRWWRGLAGMDRQKLRQRRPFIPFRPAGLSGGVSGALRQIVMGPALGPVRFERF